MSVLTHPRVCHVSCLDESDYLCTILLFKIKDDLKVIARFFFSFLFYSYFLLCMQTGAHFCARLCVFHLDDVRAFALFYFSREWSMTLRWCACFCPRVRCLFSFPIFSPFVCMFCVGGLFLVYFSYPLFSLPISIPNA